MGVFLSVNMLRDGGCKNNKDCHMLNTNSHPNLNPSGLAGNLRRSKLKLGWRFAKKLIPFVREI